MASEVVEGVWVGGLQATSAASLASLGITHVLSLELERPVLATHIAHLFIPLTDEQSSDLLSHLPAAMAFLRRGLASDGRVLVHCRHGVSRSCAVAAAHLVAEGWRLEAALARGVERRQGSCPNPGFLLQLQLWEGLGGRLDSTSALLAHYLLQQGVVRCQEVPPSPTTSGYRCRRCRYTVAASWQVFPHLPATFPSWSAPLPPGSVPCSAGLLVTPPPWVERAHLLRPASRLLCPGCSAKLGSQGEGVSCACGAVGGRGILLLPSRLDLAASVVLPGAGSSARQCARTHADSEGARAAASLV